MTTAFVLSGGACLGAAQAGMLEALYEREVHPDLLIGTSVGAMNAAFAASRPASVATAIELQRLWRSMNRSRVFPVNPISVGLGFLGTLDHSVPVGALRRLVDRHLGFGRLEDAPVALHVLAADVLSGEEVRLSSGNALDAVLASAVVAITRAITRRLEDDVAWAADHAEVIVLPGPALEGVLPTDFARADELIEEALRRSRAVLARHAPRRHPRAA